ncbi:hypothetical protein NQ315_013920 [Exocentrus adspersus]|uniref:Outer dynein arm-docking complex subunit 4 n=1 Tax=Exocentrus adspersus TaxID=1586481 RepID=A0AAV8VRX1_9CUCU|nr:hypothetical protein NQ315_013920 [Exocentrus adspersus]
MPSMRWNSTQLKKNALVARSKCYILLGQPDNALKDAETALQIDRHFIKAIYQKAEALYYLGDFEHSLVYYHRGLHIRPDHEGFKLGVHKAQKAIENAIGASLSGLIRSRSGSVGNISMKSAASVATSVSEIPSKKSDVGLRPKTANRTTPHGTQKSLKKSRLLRELGPDKDYLDNLMQNPNIRCKYKDNDSTVENYIRDTVEYLNARQEFWRQQLPRNLK